jgi:hypothetical protein
MIRRSSTVPKKRKKYGEAATKEDKIIESGVGNRASLEQSKAGSFECYVANPAADQPRLSLHMSPYLYCILTGRQYSDILCASHWCFSTSLVHDRPAI